MGIIYKATNNVNGKPYIGKTIQKLKQRIYVHKAYAKKGSRHIFAQAIKKYGIENFGWEVICECDNEILDIMETMKIISNNTHYLDGYGYNMTYGGEGCLGYKHPPEAREKISKSKQGKNNPMYGKVTKGYTGHHHNEEIKELIGQKSKEVWNNLGEKEKQNRLKPFIDSCHTKEADRKRSEALKGHFVAEETKSKISVSLKLYYKNKM